MEFDDSNRYEGECMMVEGGSMKEEGRIAREYTTNLEEVAAHSSGLRAQRATLGRRWPHASIQL